MIKTINDYLNRKTSLYFLLTVIITSGGNFFVTIFLWNKLEVKDFALISILEIIPMFILGIMTFSLDQYLMRHYYEWVENNRFSNAIYVWIISALFGTLILLIFSLLAYLFSKNIFQNQNVFPFIILSLTNIYVTSLYNVPFSIIRITNSPKFFFVVKVSSFAIYIFVLFLLVFYKNLGLEGYFISLIISNVFHLAATITIQKNNLFNIKNFNPSISFKSVLRYVTPLVPANIFGSSMGVIERILLQKFVTVDLIGHFSIANKFAELINHLHGILKLSYGPILFKTVSTKDNYKINKFSINVKSYIFPILFLFIFILSFGNHIINFFNINGGILINEILRLSIISVTLNSLQIYVAPGPIVTKKSELKFILDLSLLILLSSSTFLFLKYFDIFYMLKVKNIIMFLFLVISYFVTNSIINWELDKEFMFSNLFVLFLIVLSTFFPFNSIFLFGILLIFLFLNFKILSLFYETYK